jgi:hypothetical protein
MKFKQFDRLVHLSDYLLYFLLDQQFHAKQKCNVVYNGKKKNQRGKG